MVVVVADDGSGEYNGNCVFIVLRCGNDGVKFCCDGDGRIV